MRPVIRTATLSSVLVLAAACGGGAGETSPDEHAHSPTVAGEACEETDEITAVDNAFEPPCSSVPAQVTVTNEGRLPHTFTIPDTDVDVALSRGVTETVDLGEVTPGEEIQYHCTIHPQMVGHLTVEA